MSGAVKQMIKMGILLACLTPMLFCDTVILVVLLPIEAMVNMLLWAYGGEIRWLFFPPMPETRKCLRRIQDVRACMLRAQGGS